MLHYVNMFKRSLFFFFLLYKLSDSDLELTVGYRARQTRLVLLLHCVSELTGVFLKYIFETSLWLTLTLRIDLHKITMFTFVITML